MMSNHFIAGFLPDGVLSHTYPVPGHSNPIRLAGTE